MVDSTGRSLNFARYEAHYFTHLYDSLEASGLPIPAWLKNLDMDLTREMAEEAQGYADDAWFTEVYFDLAILSTTPLRNTRTILSKSGTTARPLV